jgi:hypothetical protein
MRCPPPKSLSLSHLQEVPWTSALNVSAELSRFWLKIVLEGKAAGGLILSRPFRFGISSDYRRTIQMSLHGLDCIFSRYRGATFDVDNAAIAHFAEEIPQSPLPVFFSHESFPHAFLEIAPADIT